MKMDSCVRLSKASTMTFSGTRFPESIVKRVPFAKVMALSTYTFLIPPHPALFTFNGMIRPKYAVVAAGLTMSGKAFYGRQSLDGGTGLVSLQQLGKSSTE
ncbi:MAG: hypothetical protein JNK90_09700 [Planctomycetaceae bacterium]|nr:hypothetical protein [Planctomycetaceae bacterium]